MFSGTTLNKNKKYIVRTFGTDIKVTVNEIEQKIVATRMVKYIFSRQKSAFVKHFQILIGEVDIAETVPINHIDTYDLPNSFY